MNSPVASVVLIPGYMLDDTLWHDVIACFPAHWTITKPTLADGLSIPEIARNMARQVPDGSVLVGFSLGGYVARQLAADYPKKVSALVLVASSLREDSPEQAAMKQQAVAGLSPATFSGISSGAISRALHPTRRSDTELIRRIQGMGARLGYAAYAAQSGLNRTNVPTTSIRCPVLIIASSNDDLRPVEESEEMYRAMPGASIEWVEDCGHMIPLEQPRALAETILAWLGRE